MNDEQEADLLAKRNKKEEQLWAFFLFVCLYCFSDQIHVKFALRKAHFT
ncbi:hypothetical protein [Planococcus sp. YIM B11945]